MEIDKIQATLQKCSTAFEKITEEEWGIKSNPEKWSKKEVLGHLIDSALTNLRRFVMTQYVQEQKIIYHQDEWVSLQYYQDANHLELINLWRLLNDQIIRVVKEIPETKREHLCDTGKNGIQLHALEYLVKDYAVHLEHHLNQIMKN